MFSLAVLSGLQLLDARLTFRCMSHAPPLTLLPHPCCLVATFEMMRIKKSNVTALNGACFTLKAVFLVNLVQ